jgi:hypothetical protein
MTFTRRTSQSVLPDVLLVRMTVVGTATPAARVAVTTATTGAITGTVTSTSGAIAGACVTALWSNGGGKRTTTTSTGAYSLSGLPPGLWEVYFSGCGTKNFASQWWDGQPTQVTSRAVTVTAGRTTSGISARLAGAGEITGTVTAAGSSTGIAGVCAYALDSTFQAGQSASGSAVTNSAGTYMIVGLAAGTYIVEFQPCSKSLNRLATWWNSSNEAFATPLTVTDGTTTSGISVSMAAGGSMAGTITSAATKKPVAGVCAYALLPTTVTFAEPGGTVTEVEDVPVASVETGTTGTYTMTGLAPGNYFVEVSDCSQFSNVNYLLPVVYGQTSDPTIMPPVVVTAGATTGGLNVALKAGGVVTGVIASGVTHKPIAGMCALLFNVQGFGFFGGPSAANGVYSVEGLPSGSYQAELGPCGSQNYLVISWDNGATFNVTDGKVTSGISGSLPPGGTISGTVSTSFGTPLSDLCISIGQNSGGVVFTQIFGPIGFGGTYSIDALPTGDYQVGFQTGCAPQFTLNYQPAVYNNGTPVAVQAGATVTGIDVKMPVGGEITGTVTDSSSRQLSLTCVTADSPNSGNPFGVEVSSFGGSYVLAGLTPGKYQVFFQDCNGDNYQSAEYQGGLQVTVAAGHNTGGISAVLQPGGEISGTVTNTSSVPLSDICVAAFGEFQPQAEVTDTAFGTYSFVGLIPNTEYEVEFYTCGVGNYSSQWWDNAATQATATPFTVTVASPATNINAKLTS